MNRAIIGKPEHSVAWGSWRTIGRKGKKCINTMVGPMLWKPTVLIGVPLNGKMFWMRAERFHTTINSWQVDVR